MVYSNLDEKGRAYYGCLATQHGLGYAGITQLLRVFGSPSEIYGASPEKWKAVYPRITDECVQSLSRGPDPIVWERILEKCRALGVKIAAPGSPEYPGPLLSLALPPPLLFIQGGWREEDSRSSAMVGTRSPSDYGRKVAFNWAQELAHKNVTVVSGLAVGIDAEAHAGALEGEGRTVAVIGCGHAVDYPQANRELKKRISDHGAVISEFPPEEAPKPNHFPRRNRILSGLAQVTVVIEAGVRSGALLTAAHARTQGRIVMAVPGSIFSPVSLGTHGLIRRGAFPAVSVSDILEKLGSKPGARQSLKAAEAADPVLALWEGERASPLDHLVQRAKSLGFWPPEKAVSALMESLLRLEIQGMIQRLPGPVYRRITICAG